MAETPGTAGSLRQCDMILMDSSPLIYLAKAGCLNLLLHFARRIYVPDEVYFESAGRWFDPYLANVPPPADAVQIRDFMRVNADRFQTVQTQLGFVLQRDRLAGLPVDVANAGEMAAVSVFERRRELTGLREPVLVIFEDSEVPLRFANKDVHLLSTFALFLVMEKAGYLVSAQAAFNTIPAGERPSRLPVDVSVVGDTSYVGLIDRPS